MTGSKAANDGAAPSRRCDASEAAHLLQQVLAILDATHAPAEIAAYVQTALDALNEHLASK